MSTRFASILLIALLTLLQGQLWFGRGSVPHVMQLQKKLHELKVKNQETRLANELLSSEVADLKEGLETIEAIARADLGMIKPNEILVQYSR